MRNLVVKHTTSGLIVSVRSSLAISGLDKALTLNHVIKLVNRKDSMMLAHIEVSEVLVVLANLSVPTWMSSTISGVQ
jgi:hypothetical protein